VVFLKNSGQLKDDSKPQNPPNTDNSKH